MENKKLTKIALMYDFDHTLCDKDMQEYSFIPSVGMSSEEFWSEANKIATKNNMDKILAYMFLMIRSAKKNDIAITEESFRNLGKDVVLLKGVKTWFKRINDFGLEHGAKIEHYIISSGLAEIIKGTPIAKEFKKIYACEFHYNNSGNADWPQQVVNYTTKTQFIFRISKGVLDTMDDKKLNSRSTDAMREIPYRNMIYIGDGLTDVPCMTVIRDRGGETIGIYHHGKKETANQLLVEKRVNYICKANYSKDSELESIVKKIIHKMVITDELVKLQETQLKEITSNDE